VPSQQEADGTTLRKSEMVPLRGEPVCRTMDRQSFLSQPEAVIALIERAAKA
jgi:hypothetical protein